MQLDRHRALLNQGVRPLLHVSRSHLVLLAIVIACLTGFSWTTLTTHITPQGDLAADMLLTNYISERGYLLLGHYSRWEFNHPGPFWFYYNWLMERVLSWTTLPRFQVWQLGSVFLNSSLIFFSALSLSNFFLKRFNLFYAIAFVAILLGFIGSEIVDLWMPNRLIAPYLAFLVCLLHLQAGNHKYIAFAVLLTSVLVHGYATMPFFTIPLLGIALGLGYFRKQDPIRLPNARNQVYASLAIIFIFILPMVIEFLTSSPSNVYKLLSVQAAFESMPKPSWQEMNTFISNLMLDHNSVSWLVSYMAIAIILASMKLAPEQKQRVLISLSLCLLITLAILLYHKRTPAPLHAFVAKYYIVIPVLMMTTAISSVFNELPSAGSRLLMGFRLHQIIKYGLVLLVCASFFYPTNKPNTLPGWPNDGQLIRELADQVESRNTEPVVSIDYSAHDQWPSIAGLLLELDRRGVEACTTWAHMNFLYTAKEICPTETTPNMKLVKASECDGACFFTANEHGLVDQLPTQ